MLLVYLFFLHFVADFLLQSREMGKKKSTEIMFLLKHLGIQYAVVMVGMAYFLGLRNAAALSMFNALIHGVIDWNIWRGYKALVTYRLGKATPTSPIARLMDNTTGFFKYYEDHWFYATIGLDQFLHIATLTLLLGAFHG